MSFWDTPFPASSEWERAMPSMTRTRAGRPVRDCAVATPNIRNIASQKNKPVVPVVGATPANKGVAGGRAGAIVDFTLANLRTWRTSLKTAVRAVIVLLLLLVTASDLPANEVPQLSLEKKVGLSALVVIGA